MRILLISGHGDGDPGAVYQGLQEANLTIDMVKGIKEELSNYCDVDLYPIERNAYKDAVKRKLQRNFKNYDYVFEVHFNACGGTGSEIYVTSKEKTVNVEKGILKSLEKYYKNRGVKVGNFLVINLAKSAGVSSALLETCFLDSTSDIATYNKNATQMQKTIATAIADGFGLTKNKVTTPTKSIDTIVQEVRNGKWGNGTDRKAALTNAGYDYVAVQNKINALFQTSTIEKGDKFTILPTATIYGGASYGVKIPSSIKNSNKTYTCLKILEKNNDTWLLASSIMSYVKMSECKKV